MFTQKSQYFLNDIYLVGQTDPDFSKHMKILSRVIEMLQTATSKRNGIVVVAKSNLQKRDLMKISHLGYERRESHWSKKGNLVIEFPVSESQFRTRLQALKSIKVKEPIAIWPPQQRWSLNLYLDELVFYVYTNK